MAYLCLVRSCPAFDCSSHCCSAFLAAPVCRRTRLGETREGVRYHSGDWVGPDQRHMVDVLPQPLGGMRAFLSRLDYPVALRQQSVTGIVRVRVALDRDGHVLSARIIQSVHPTLDAIVLSAVNSTKWMPAQKNGRPVAWTFSFPVAFSRRDRSNQTMEPTAPRAMRWQ